VLSPLPLLALQTLLLPRLLLVAHLGLPLDPSLLLLDSATVLGLLQLLALRAQLLASLLLLVGLDLPLGTSLTLHDAGLGLSLLPCLAPHVLLLPGLKLLLGQGLTLPAALLAQKALRLVPGLGGAEGVVARDDSGGCRSGQHRTARDGTGVRRIDSRPFYLGPENG